MEIKTEPIEITEGGQYVCAKGDYIITKDMTFADIIRFLIDLGCDKEEAMILYEGEE